MLGQSSFFQKVLKTFALKFYVSLNQKRWTCGHQTKSKVDVGKVVHNWTRGTVVKVDFKKTGNLETPCFHVFLVSCQLWYLR